MASKELHEYLAPLLWRSYACLACGHILFSPSCVLPSVRELVPPWNACSSPQRVTES